MVIFCFFTPFVWQRGHVRIGSRQRNASLQASEILHRRANADKEDRSLQTRLTPQLSPTLTKGLFVPPTSIRTSWLCDPTHARVASQGRFLKLMHSFDPEFGKVGVFKILDTYRKLFCIQGSRLAVVVNEADFSIRACHLVNRICCC